MILWRLKAKIVDVETAFLHGELEEVIYMKCPEGMVHQEDECLLLLKSIYGLAQSARQYYKKFISILRKIGFEGGQADPCLFIRRGRKGICFIAIWVDDSLLIGDEDEINEVIQDLRKHELSLKIGGSLEDYLSCEITMDHKRNIGWIHQPHLLKKLDEKFGKLVKGLQTYRTPGTPGQTLIRKVGATISQEQQSIYRSGVGMLLYLVKHTRPDIANAVRELSKCLDNTSPNAYKELL